MSQRPLRILIVDDNRDIVTTTMDLVRARGHEGMACYDGLSVIKCVQQFDPDVVVMDIGLPGRSGWDAAKDIRASIAGKRPLLVGVTGEYSRPEHEAWAEKSGFDYYLIKPVDPKVLLVLIDEWADLSLKPK
jgi:DNA-binding response OmpR family regulator